MCGNKTLFYVPLKISLKWLFFYRNYVDPGWREVNTGART